MTSTTTDRRSGVQSGAAVKLPVVVATTANITLSGEQTIDGVAIVSGNRVLVKDQTDGTENGIYAANTSTWQREPDWDGANDVVQGTTVYATQGTANNKWWRVTTSGTITIGTTSVTIVQGLEFEDASAVTVQREEANSTETNLYLDIQERSIRVGQHFGSDLSLTNGTDDWTGAINAALDAGRASGVSVIQPMGKFKITGSSELNCHLVNYIGETSSDNSTITHADGSPWPVLIYDASLTATGMCRIGGTSSTAASDRSVFKNFNIDMSAAPTNAIGVYCEKGVYYKEIDNIYIRGKGSQTIAQHTTANHTGFKFQIDATSTQGLYYLKIGDIAAFDLFRGFYSDGHSNDGMAGCTINAIRTWLCVQGITLKDGNSNVYNHLGIQSFLSGYDPSGATPTEWGIWMDNENNTVSSTYIEGSGTETTPYIFTTANNQWNIRDLNAESGEGYNAIQTIDSSNNRISSSRVTNTTGEQAGLLTGQGIIEVNTIGGPQVQQGLLPNDCFRFWLDGATPNDMSDGDSFAHVWKAAKGEATATLKINDALNAASSMTFNKSVKLEVTSPVADNLYGMKIDLADFIEVDSGTSALATIGTMWRDITIGVICRPGTSGEGETTPQRVRIEVSNDGSTVTSSENYTIDYDFRDESGQDEPITGAPGDWQTLVHHYQPSSGDDNIEISFGLYPEDTTGRITYVDAIIVIQGKHTQFALKQYIELAKIQPVVANANTNSLVSITSADASDLATAITLVNEIKADLNALTTNYAVKVGDGKTSDIIHLPGFASEW